MTGGNKRTLFFNNHALFSNNRGLLLNTRPLSPIGQKLSRRWHRGHGWNAVSSVNLGTQQVRQSSTMLRHLYNSHIFLAE